MNYMSQGHSICSCNSVLEHVHYYFRFYINLHLEKGHHEKVDSALHLKPCFSENHVVRNSFLQHEWGIEETHGQMPLHRGAGFECIILATPTEFRVSWIGTDFS